MNLKWYYFRQRPNLSHLNEAQKWQLFLLENEKLNEKLYTRLSVPSNGGNGEISSPIPTSTNAIVQIWLNKLQSDGIEFPSQERINIYTAAWDYADANGITPELDLFGLLLVEHPDHAKVPFIHSGGSSKRFTFVGELTFSEFRGIKGVDSPEAYIDTNWKASVDGVKFVAGDGSLGAFVHDFLTSDAPVIADTFFDDPIYADSVIIPKSGSSGITIYVQDKTDGVGSYGVAISASALTRPSFGLTCGTYKSGVGKLWRDGVLLAQGAEEAPATDLSYETNMLIFKDVANDLNYTGYARAMYVGSALEDKQSEMYTFFSMLLAGVSNTFILNSTGADILTSATMYSNVSNTAYISTDEYSFNIFSQNLSPSTGSITVSVPDNFQFYDGSSWQTGTISVSYSGGSINSTYKVRLTKQLPIGNYSGSLIIEGGNAESVSLSLFGESLAVSSNLTTWQSTLTGSLPSGKLLKALNAFVDGMITDGNLANMDFLMIAAGMETDEQRLLPIKTTSASIPTLQGATPPSGSTSGFASTGTGYINFNWVPSVNGVNFTQNNASLHCVAVVSGASRVLVGAEDAAAVGRVRLGTLVLNPAGSINDATFFPFLSGGTGTNYFAIYRTNGTTKVGYKNGSAGTNISVSSNGFSSNSIFGLAYNNNGTVTSPVQAGGATARMWFWGTNTISASQMRTRMNTYFTFIGLTTV